MKIGMKIGDLALSLLVGLCVFASCEKASVSVFEKGNIPSEIENDFYARYGDVAVTDAAQWAYDGHIAIEFKDRDGLQCEATYLEGEWLMTTKDLREEEFMSHLPIQVRRSLRELGYYHPRFDVVDNSDRVLLVTRKDIGHDVYDFRFHIELENGSFSPIQVLINEDGLVLLDSRDGYNKQELFYWTDNTPFEVIEGKYPGADIRSYANYGGRHQYFIIHDGRKKIVTFDSYYPLYSYCFTWRDTVYELDEDTVVPSAVVDYYELMKMSDPRYYDSTYDKLLFRESSTANWYGFQDTKREDKLIWWINVNVAE